MFLAFDSKTEEISIYSDFLAWQKRGKHGAAPGWLEVPLATYSRFTMACESNSRMCPDCKQRTLEQYRDRIRTIADYDKSTLPATFPKFQPICRTIYCRCGMSFARVKFGGRSRYFKQVRITELDGPGIEVFTTERTTNFAERTTASAWSMLTQEMVAPAPSPRRTVTVRAPRAASGVEWRSFTQTPFFTNQSPVVSQTSGTTAPAPAPDPTEPAPVIFEPRFVIREEEDR